MKRWIAGLTALAAAVLFAAPAFAQATTFFDGQKLGPDGMQRFPQLIGGVYYVDSTGHALKINVNGSLSVQDAAPVYKNWTNSVNFGISSTSIAAKGSKIGTPVFFGDYTGGNLQITLAAADSADTSCAWMIYVFAKQGSTAGDGLDFQIPAAWSFTTNTWMNATVVDSSLWGAMPSGWFIGSELNNATKNPYYSGDIPFTSVRVPGTHIIQSVQSPGAPLQAIRMARTTQFVIPLPIWLRAQYINVIVFNMSVSASHTITVDAFFHS